MCRCHIMEKDTLSVGCLEMNETLSTAILTVYEMNL